MLVSSLLATLLFTHAGAHSFDQDTMHRGELADPLFMITDIITPAVLVCIYSCKYIGPYSSLRGDLEHAWGFITRSGIPSPSPTLKENQNTSNKMSVGCSSRGANSLSVQTFRNS